MRRLIPVIIATFIAGAAMAQISPSPDMINRVSLQTVSDPAIQKEIKLTSQQKLSLTRLQAAFKEEVAARNQDAINASFEQRLEMINELTFIMNREIQKMLTKQQLTRLRQIRMQQQGVMSLGFTDVQTDLKLSQDQRNQINNLIGLYTQEQEDQFQKIRSGEAKTPSAEERTARRTKLDNDLLSVLTPDQVTAYVKLKGEPYIDGTKKPAQTTVPKQ